MVAENKASFQKAGEAQTVSKEMTVACYLDALHPGRSELMRLFADGCKGRLVKMTVPDPEASDHVVIAKGIAEMLVPEFKRRNLPFWYIDSAYIQVPGQRYSRIERSAYWPPEDMGIYSMDRARSFGVSLKLEDGSAIVGPG